MISTFLRKRAAGRVSVVVAVFGAGLVLLSSATVQAESVARIWDEQLLDAIRIDTPSAYRTRT
ncbi:MAG: hypothetical protein R3C45_16680 [Phycisphaerales bacterium]